MLKTKAHEEHAIVNALRIAAEAYDGDAALSAKCQQPRLAEQFKVQAAQARSLAERIENGALAFEGGPHA